MLISIGGVSAYDINEDSCLSLNESSNIDDIGYDDLKIGSNEGLEDSIKVSSVKSNDVIVNSEVSSVKGNEIIVDSGNFDDLSNAINNAGDNTKIIVSGNYKFNSTLKIMSSNVTLVGTKGTVFDINGIYHMMVGTNGAIEPPLTGINISGITFINGKTSDYGGALIIGQSAEGTYISNCTFENNTAACGSAIYFNGAVDMYNSSKVFRTATIENCIFNSNVPIDVVGGCVFVYKYNVTVINCSLSNSGRGSTTYGFGGGIGVHYGGLTVKDTTFDSNTAQNGAGIMVQGGDSLDVINCTFVNNTAGLYGGAIYIVTDTIVKLQYKCKVSVSNSTFINNSANYAGVIYEGEAISPEVDNSYTLFENCTFVGNKAIGYGGVLLINPSSTSKVKDEFKNCTFINNSAGKSGGAIASLAKSFDELLVNNCTFLNNTAEQYAGAIYYHTTDANLTINKSVFVDNTADTDMGHAIFMWTGRLNMENSILERNGFVDDRSYVSIYLSDRYNAKIVSVENNFWGNYTDVYPFTEDEDYGSLIMIQKQGTSGTYLDPYYPKQWVAMNITGPMNVSLDTPYNYDVKWYLATGNSDDDVTVSNTPIADGTLPDYDGVVNKDTSDLVYIPNGSLNHTFTDLDDLYIGVYSPFTGNLLADINPVIKKYATDVNGTNVSGKPGSNVEIDISVVDSEGNPVKEGLVNVILPDGSNKTIEVNDGKTSVNWTIPEDYSVGDYKVDINFLDNNFYINSTNMSFVKVLPLDTVTVISNVSGIPNDIVSIDVTVNDELGRPISEGDVILSLPDGTNKTVSIVDGKGSVNWTIPKDFDDGNYDVTGSYAGNNDFNPSEGEGGVVVTSPFINLDLIKGDYNLTVGETAELSYKLYNSGTAEGFNIKSTFVIPKGLDLVSVSVEEGTYNWDPSTRTLTWFVDELDVDKEYVIKFNLKALDEGTYTIVSDIVSDYRYDCNGSANINVEDSPDPNPDPNPNPNPNPSQPPEGNNGNAEGGNNGEEKKDQ